MSFLYIQKSQHCGHVRARARCCDDAVLSAAQAGEQQRLAATTAAAAAREDALASQLADCRRETERAQEEVRGCIDENRPPLDSCQHAACLNANPGFDMLLMKSHDTEVVCDSGCS